MQITLDVSSLTAAERSHVAQFITDYPTPESVQGNASFDDVIAPMPSFTFPVVEEEDEDEVTPAPEVSFGPVLVPTIPPPPPVPVAPVATTGVTLDKNGFPWDDRIHSGNKAFVADGTWRKRRGVDDALVAQVEVELRAVMNIAAPAPVIPPIPVVQVAAEIPADEAPMMPMHNASTVPPPPPLPAIVPPPPPPPPPPPAVAEPNAYLNLIQLVTNVISTQKLTRPQVEACITSIDPSLNLQLLSKRPDLIPQIAAQIRTLVA